MDIKEKLLELEDYSEKEYYRNMYLAKIFRKERKFTTALKYYAAASIYLTFFKKLSN